LLGRVVDADQRHAPCGGSAVLPSVDPPVGFYEHMLRRGPAAACRSASGVLVGGARGPRWRMASLSAPSHNVKPAINPLVEDHVVSASLLDDPVGANSRRVVVPTTRSFVSTSTTAAAKP